ncbi:hypothetical protein D7319_31215 [Streptomyces radicis]|uniref:Uncharacterized protein n=2 Tax=Streptomyces radicis TaxID=1750517 RepID=A0A3A9W2Z1_9ACTN|nr:hypothetical protein D7319_31215 [Streptomyces radicis]RKN13435.1 hypothetical protein D7318_31210 [Streptomyces radicis]
MDLPGDLSDAELAELRWQVGLGPRPEHITRDTIVVTEVVDAMREGGEEPVPAEGGDWVIQRYPGPAWESGAPRAASRVPGSCVSSLVHEDAPHGKRWALTCRWEIHPDGYPEVDAFFRSLAALHRDGGAFFGYLRWYEDPEPDAWLRVEDRKVVAHHKGARVALPWEWTVEGGP